MLRFLGCLMVAGFLLAQRAPVDEAWDLLANGQRGQAVLVLRRIVSANPRDAEARLMLGSILAEEGNRSESLEQLEEAVRLRPRSAQAHHALGEALRRFGEAPAAREAFEKAVVLDPRFAQAQADLGLALLEAGEPSAAAEHLDQAILIFGRDPDSAYARYLRAKIHAECGEVDQATAQLTAAVSLQPDFAEAWSDLGQAKKTRLDDAGALAAFEQSVKADPANAVSQYRLGSEYLRQKKVSLAVLHLRGAYRLDPRNQSTLYSLQLALRQDGQLEQAARIKEELTALLREIDRESQSAFVALRLNNEGAVREKAGDLPGALEKYRGALALDPEHVGIRLNFAAALIRLGRWKEGLSELREALRRDPGNTQIQTALENALKQAPPEAAKE